MSFQKQGITATLLLLMTFMLVSFSRPVSDGTSLVIQPSVSVLAEARQVRARPFMGPLLPEALSLRATAYNSLASQTDSTPHITSTGATTAFGIIAASRDLLGAELPYGSLVRIRDLGSYGSGRGVGLFQEVLDEQQLFIVEDTMHIRKTRQVDVWFPDLSTALTWGVREVELEVVRYGRDGPWLEQPEPLLGSVASFAPRTGVPSL